MAASKRTPELERVIREQLKLREGWKSWQIVADLHGISRENLFKHIRHIRKRPC